MALVLQDRVREISTTTGDGTVTLSGAYPGGYRTFASCVPNSSTTYYCIHNTTNGVTDEWEVGLGTYSSNTLTRDTVLSSSAGGAKVSFSAGDKEVFITYPAEKAIFEQANGETIINAGPITVIGSNVTSIPTLSAELGKFIGNVDLFAQIYNLNQNSGQNASADFVVYNSDTDVDGLTFFADMGINSPNYSSVDYPIFTPNSGYFFTYGDGGSNTSTLFLGSGDGNVHIFAGGLETNNVVATFGADLSSTFEGAVVANSTLDVTGVAAFDTYAYSAANVASAANNTVLVTKAYVDDAVSAGVHFHQPVIYATAAVLPNSPTYNNGTDGVGATLTANANAALVIDGVTLTSPTDNGIRVLVINQSNAAHNGIYDVTEAGSGSAPWQLTRSSDADTYVISSPDGLSEGSTVYVEAGTANAGSTFTCNTQGVITFGTTAITFALVSSALTYTGGTNINVSGLTISLTGTVAATNGGTGQNTTTVGDLLYGTSSNTWSKLALGAANRSLVVNGSGTQVEWNAVPLGAAGAVSGTLDETNGGTGNTSYTTGDTLYSSAANTLAKLAGNTTTTKKFLGQTGNGSASAAPVWEQPAASDITGLAASATTDTTNASNISSGQLANARTTAASANGASTIVARDASGNFSANTITANVTGSISGSAATLTTARNFQISGGATAANVSFDGSAAVNLSVTAMNASVINTGTIANIYTTAASANGASTIVARDASGNFTAANVSATNFIGTLNGSGANVSTLNASSISTGTLASARVSGSYTGITGVGTLTAGTWNATAITDTYLSTISTAGKVSNSATTAASANGASTIVARDASGNFSAGTITATFSGSGAAVTSLNASAIASGTVPTARLASGTANSSTYLRGDSTWAALSAPNNGTLTMGVSGTGLSGSATFTADQAGSSTFTVTSNATNANTGGAIVARDGSGNFSAGTITAALSGTATTATTANALNTGNSYTGVNFTATSAVYSSGAGGFFSSTYVSGARNPIWRFADAPTYGLSYFQGSSGIGGSDTIGFHFGTATAAGSLFTMVSNGNFTASGNVTAYSDERLKKDWLSVGSDFVKKLAQVKSGTYTRIDSGERQAGASAQDMQKLLPEVVQDGEHLSLAYGNAALVAAIELAKQVVELKKEIELLKAK